MADHLNSEHANRIDAPNGAHQSACEPTDDEAAERTRRRIRQLPPEVGAVLIGVGVVGFILPGPVGTPLILAGGLVLIPRVFARIECWVQKKFPRSHRAGMKYVDRFIDDFERRYPPERGPI